jgi:hypothetical protein
MAHACLRIQIGRERERERVSERERVCVCVCAPINQMWFVLLQKTILGEDRSFAEGKERSERGMRVVTILFPRGTRAHTHTHTIEQQQQQEQQCATIHATETRTSPHKN